MQHHKAPHVASALVTSLLLVGCSRSELGEVPQAVTTSARSAHEICTAQLVAMANHFVSGGPESTVEENAINGLDDPFLAPAGSIFYSYHAEENVYSQDVRSARARARAEQACTDTLDDAQRPNYPTDGTWP